MRHPFHRAGFLMLPATFAIWSGVTVYAQQPNAPQPVAVDPLAQVRALMDTGALGKAEAAARAYAANHELSSEAHYLLGYILFHEDKPDQSLAEYTHGAQIQTPTAQQLKNVALDYVLLNDYPDADRWMTKAVSWSPEDSDAWYSLGRIKYTENRFQEAIDAFKKALALSPRLVKAEDNLGLAYEGLTQNEKAAAAYRQAIAWQAGTSDPSEQPLLNLGILLVNHNQEAQALPLLRRAEGIAPKNPRIHVTLGRLYRRQGQLALAQSELEQAVALTPNSAPYHFQLAQVYRKAGLLAKAKTQFAAAAALDGTHSTPKRDTPRQ